MLIALPLNARFAGRDLKAEPVSKPHLRYPVSFEGAYLLQHVAEILEHAEFLRRSVHQRHQHAASRAPVNDTDHLVAVLRTERDGLAGAASAVNE
jgi:hypothetical protein